MQAYRGHSINWLKGIYNEGVTFFYLFVEILLRNTLGLDY